MRKVDEFLSVLHQRGVRLRAENGRLHFQAPKGALLPEDLTNLRTLKDELVELLEHAQLEAETPVTPREAGCPIPLTAQQLRTWNYIVSRGTRLSSRRCATAVRVLGALDTCLLQKSITLVAQRHDSMRTRFIDTDGTPLQHVDAPHEFSLDLVDLSHVRHENVEDEIRRLARELSDEEIDLSEGPLFGTALFKLSDAHHVMVSVFDHMITDGMSKRIVSNEVWTVYNHLAQGLPLSLPCVPLQFGDYAVWQQRTYCTWQKRHEEYWKVRLAGAPRIEVSSNGCLAEMRCLPVSSDMWQFAFGRILSAGLRNIARRELTLLPLVVLTVYVAAMSLWCNRRDLVLLFVSNGRSRPELANVTGFVAHHLHLRVEIAPEDNFLDLLRRVTLELNFAEKHRDFDRVPSLVPECYTELYFNWIPVGSEQTTTELHRQASDRIRIQPFAFRPILQCKFLPLFSDTSDGIVATVMYRPDLFDQGSIAHFGGSLRLFAEEFVEQPLTRVISVATRSSREPSPGL